MHENEFFLQLKKKDAKDVKLLKKARTFDALRLKQYIFWPKRQNIKRLSFQKYLYFLNHVLFVKKFVICFLITDIQHFKLLLKAYGKSTMSFHYLSNTKIQKLDSFYLRDFNISMGSFPAFRICENFFEFCKDLTFLLDFGSLLEIYFLRCFGYTFFEKKALFELISEENKEKFKELVLWCHKMSLGFLNLLFLQLYFFHFLQGMFFFKVLFLFRR